MSQQIEIFDGNAQLAKEIADVRMIHAKYFGPAQPFYWTAVSDDPRISAPSGWYQWTESGLVYLGPTILAGAEGR